MRAAFAVVLFLVLGCRPALECVPSAASVEERALQCTKAAEVVDVFASNVLGFDRDRPLRVLWLNGPLPSGARGRTNNPDEVETSRAWTLCHELVHVHLARSVGWSYPDHDGLWNEAAEVTVRRCEASVEDPWNGGATREPECSTTPL